MQLVYNHFYCELCLCYISAKWERFHVFQREAFWDFYSKRSEFNFFLLSQHMIIYQYPLLFWVQKKGNFVSVVGVLEGFLVAVCDWCAAKQWQFAAGFSVWSRHLDRDCVVCRPREELSSLVQCPSQPSGSTRKETMLSRRCRPPPCCPHPRSHVVYASLLPRVRKAREMRWRGKGLSLELCLDGWALLIFLMCVCERKSIQIALVKPGKETAFRVGQACWYVQDYCEGIL